MGLQVGDACLLRRDDRLDVVEALQQLAERNTVQEFGALTGLRVLDGGDLGAHAVEGALVRSQLRGERS